MMIKDVSRYSLRTGLKSQDMDFTKHAGRFALSYHFILECFELAQHIMSQMVIVRAESLFPQEVIEYTAISSLFEEVETGAVPPEYKLELIEGELKVEKL
jgi:hypothetical protein